MGAFSSFSVGFPGGCVDGTVYVQYVVQEACRVDIERRDRVHGGVFCSVTTSSRRLRHGMEQQQQQGVDRMTD